MWFQLGGERNEDQGPSLAGGQVFFFKKGSELGLMYKDVPQKLISRWSLLGLNKDLFKKLPAVVRHVSWENRVSGLGGDFKDGCHGLKLCPRWPLCEHLHHSAANTPGGPRTCCKMRTIKLFCFFVCLFVAFWGFFCLYFFARVQLLLYLFINFSLAIWASLSLFKSNL